MIRKILAITGGGVKDVVFLTYMLRISKYYDNKGIDVLTLFDTFSGVSSGSIIASTFVLREKFLKNIAKHNPQIIAFALHKINSNYSKDEKMDIIKRLQAMTITNCSSIVIATLVTLFEKKSSEIFHRSIRSILRKIVGINGLLFSKYDDNKKKFFNEYFDFKLKDIPDGRTLIIKSINIKTIKVNIYTNYITSTKNDFIINDVNQSISEAIHFSTNSPTYFPFNNMIDGSTILNTSLLEQTFMFKNDDLVVFNLNNDSNKPLRENIIFDGLIGWVYPLLNIGIGYETNILNDLLKFKYQEKIHISNFDLAEYSIDDTRNISKLENIGKKKPLNRAVTFIDRELVIDISKIINTWKDTWKLIKTESKGPAQSIIVACEYGLLINFKFTDSEFYLINNVTNGETETYNWNYDDERMTLSYEIENDDNIKQKILRLTDKELVLDNGNECTYYTRIINTEYIVKQLADLWLSSKQDKHEEDILSMKINSNFTVELVTYRNSGPPVDSKGTWYIDADYDQFIIQQSEDDPSLTLYLNIISLTKNELKIMQKMNNDEVITTFTSGSIPL